METLRRRVPFRPDEDNGDGEDNRILDEQGERNSSCAWNARIDEEPEQEQWIAELREKAEGLDRRIYRQSQVYTVISFILHTIFFFRVSLLNETPIIFPRLFIFIQILVHVNLLLLLSPTFNTPVHRLAREIPHLPLPLPWTLATSSLAPLVSLISARSWQQTGWWSVTAVITLLVWVMLSSVRESKTNLENLEKLKYDAKGA